MLKIKAIAKDIQKAYDNGYNLYPIKKKILNNFLTPVGVYSLIRQISQHQNSKYSFIFESMQGGERFGRYTILGLPASTVITVKNHIVKIKNVVSNENEIVKVDDPLDWIDNYKKKFCLYNPEEQTFSGGLVGYFGYETIAYIEPKLQDILNKPALDENIGNLDEILLMLTTEFIVFDNFCNTASITNLIQLDELSDKQGLNINLVNKKLKQVQNDISKQISLLTKNYNHQKSSSNKSQQNTKENNQSQYILNDTELEQLVSEDFNLEQLSQTGRQNYLNTIKNIKQYIKSGDVMQVVLSQQMVIEYTGDPFNIYLALRYLNPSPYMYFLNLDDVYIVGSSPEILVKLEQGKLFIRPLAGTRPRGKTEAEDRILEKELLADPKEIAEHTMLIDLGRNDLGKISEIGSIELTDKMIIERYSHVMHIVSNVTGMLAKDLSVIDVLKATFPAGTLSGAPKIRAMEIISELEKNKRGVYSGAIGYLGFNGNFDTAIAIRTGVVKNNNLYIQAGAGIVADSVPKMEWLETKNKSMALFKARKLVEIMTE